VLEVGCGGGAVARHLGARGYAVVGVDTAEVLVRKAHERLPQATFVAGSVEKLDPSLGPFDVLGFFDVLEHLADPLALLRQALIHARPGALVVATVPALRALYSAIDALAGHKRRYEPGELEQTFAEAGLEGVAGHGMFRLLLPILRVRRTDVRVPPDPEARRRLLFADMRTPPSPLNQALRLACELEARLGLERSRGKPGPSLLVVGRVPA
jgi:SAM-dependent methyltransferase